MNAPAIRLLLLTFITALAAGCANIVPPSGGEKDVQPPRLLSITPADSALGVRVSKVRFDFDEYITLADAASQVLISPLLPVAPTVTALNKHMTIQFPDSLLQPNTTYRITLGRAVRDLNESNPYAGNGFIFSTGTYFDSLSISGKVTDAMTGLPDTAATVMLYNATDGDSTVVKRRPLYATHVDGSGNFGLNGLPARPFLIYALRDKNANLVFDDWQEWIAFHNTALRPGEDSSRRIELRTFPLPGSDTIAQAKKENGFSRRDNAAPSTGGTGYTVAADTTDTRRRTQDVTSPLKLNFAIHPSALDKDKIFLAYDSSGITVEAPVKLTQDAGRHTVSIATAWAENAVYTLRLQKGFAKDSVGNDYLPGRYPFRTKWADDYAKLTVHLPAKYYGAGYVLQVSNETDTLYKKPVLDSNVALVRLPPGNYSMLVIQDDNHNGIWDTGDLFGRKQPERVIPFGRTILLKPGWENSQDFEPEPANASKKADQKFREHSDR